MDRVYKCCYNCQHGKKVYPPHDLFNASRRHCAQHNMSSDGRCAFKLRRHCRRFEPHDVQVQVLIGSKAATIKLRSSKHKIESRAE